MASREKFACRIGSNTISDIRCGHLIDLTVVSGYNLEVCTKMTIVLLELRK